MTGDRQVLGATAVEFFREQMVASEDAKNMVSAELSSLPNIPAISKTTSELLMQGVSLQTEEITFGNLSSGLTKGTVNSFLSNGDVVLNFGDVSAVSTSNVSQTNVTLDTQVELSVYSFDEPLIEANDFVHFVALGGKERAGESAQAISEFTDVLRGQGTVDESGAPVVASKLKLFDFSENDATEIDADEIIMQLAEGEGVVLLAPDQVDGRALLSILIMTSPPRLVKFCFLGSLQLEEEQENRRLLGMMKTKI